MKKLAIFLCVICLLFAAGCGSGGDVTAKKTTDEVSTAKEEAVTVGSRSNPVPYGDTATWDLVYYGENGEAIEGNVSLGISDVVRGEEAYNNLLTFNQFNEAPPEGSEWVYFTATFTLNEGSDDVAYCVLPNFTVIDSSGSEVSQTSYASFETGDEFGYKDLYKGGNAIGKVAMLLPLGDDALVEFDDWNGESVFFALQ